MCILATAATVCGIALASFGGHVVSARADNCDPSICGSSGGGTTTPPPPPTTTPTHHKHVNLPPGPVTDLHGVTHRDAPGQITMLWTNPGANDLAEIIVRRGPVGDCPKTITEGRPIGDTTIRTSQTDHHAGRASGYCYSVFAVDKAGQASIPVARSVAPPDLTPPSAPTGVVVSGTPGHVVVAWTAATGNPNDYIVRRSASGHCPPGPTRAHLVNPVGAGTTTVTDDTAVAGKHYCYAVFAVDKAGNVSAAGDSQPFTASATTRPPATQPSMPPSTPPAAQSQPASSPVIPAELARLVAAIAVAVIVFGVIVLGGIRILQNPRRRQQWTYDNRTTPGAPRITIERYDARALVIPTVIVVLGVICIVALAGVLL
jgi:hypothetical protein